MRKNAYNFRDQRIKVERNGQVRRTSARGIVYSCSLLISRFQTTAPINIIVNVMSTKNNKTWILIIWNILDRLMNLPAICQANIEFHFPPTLFDETFERFFQNLEAFIARGHALLHVGFLKRFSFLRAYFVNHINDQCVQKFLCSKKT